MSENRNRTMKLHFQRCAVVSRFVTGTCCGFFLRFLILLLGTPATPFMLARFEREECMATLATRRA